MSREQIEEMACKDCIHYEVCMYVNAQAVEYARAENCNLFKNNAGYRKQSEGEWVYKFTLDGDRFYECSVCGRQEVVNGLCKERNLAEDRPYCHCGAHMKGV